MRKKLLTLLGSAWLALSPVVAVPSYPQAVAEYNAGQYQQALSDFKVLEQAYPTNALVHYYMALSHQNLGHIGDAKQEFNWVSQYGDARLKAMASIGAAALGKLRSTSGGSQSIAMATSGPSRGAAPAASAGQGKVKKIIEFYADW